MKKNSSSETFDLNDKKCIRYVRRFTNAKSFITSFRSKYESIIAYHGTNINNNDVSSIKTEGLKKASIELLKQRAIDRFILSTDDEPLRNKILKIINEQFIKEDFITVGEINLTIDKSPLQDLAYHYLLFGPESLFPIADQLRKNCFINFRKRMMEYGLSTIVKVQVPVLTTNDMWIESIFNYINDDGFECCLVYRHDLGKEHVLELEFVSKPIDKFGFLYM